MAPMPSLYKETDIHGSQSIEARFSETDTSIAGKSSKGETVKRTQRIWYRSNSSSVPTPPTTWLTEDGDKYNAWSTKVTPQASSTSASATQYIYLWTCEQYETAVGTIGHTPVLVDGSNTVISGGNLVNGSVTTNQLNAASINAWGSLTVGALSADAQDEVLNSNVVVGARNWLLQSVTYEGWYKDSGVSSSNGVVTFQSRSSLGSYHLVYPGRIPIAEFEGRTWTISFDYRSDSFSDTSGTRYIGVYKEYFNAAGDVAATSYEEVSDSASTRFVPTSAWQRGSITFDGDPSWGDPATMNYAGVMFRQHTKNSFQLRRIKLEVGNKATDWTPAPEDAGNADTYGYVDHLGSTGAYDVPIDGFVLYDGAEITVYFDCDHAGGYFNVNVNGTGAYGVIACGEACDWDNNVVFCAGTWLSFRYTSNAWWLLDKPGSIVGASNTDGDRDTKVVDVDGSFVYMRGTTLIASFTNGNSYEDDEIYLNVGGITYGKYAVYADNAMTSSTNTLFWNDDTTMTFTYDGEFWKLSEPMRNYVRADGDGVRIAVSDPRTATTYQHQTALGTAFYVNGILRNRINADGMQLFVPTTGGGRAEAATFGSSLVELAKNSASAVIKMVSGLMQLSYTAASGSETGAGKLFSEDGLMLDSNPKSINGEQVGRAFLWFHGTRVNNDGINAKITLSANSDPDNTADDGYRHSASINIVGGDAGMSSGSPTSAYVSVSDPYRLSNYLQIGSPGYESSSDTKTVPNNTTTTICSISLPAGVWMVNSFMQYAQNGSGVRKAGLVTSSTGSCDHAWAPADGDVTTADMIHRREITASTTYYLRAYQNSGTSLSVSGSIVAYRLT